MRAGQRRPPPWAGSNCRVGHLSCSRRWLGRRAQGPCVLPGQRRQQRVDGLPGQTPQTHHALRCCAPAPAAGLGSGQAPSRAASREGTGALGSLAAASPAHSRRARRRAGKPAPPTEAPPTRRGPAPQLRARRGTNEPRGPGLPRPQSPRPMSVRTTRGHAHLCHAHLSHAPGRSLWKSSCSGRVGPAHRGPALKCARRGTRGDWARSLGGAGACGRAHSALSPALPCLAPARVPSGGGHRHTTWCRSSWICVP